MIEISLKCLIFLYLSFLDAEKKNYMSEKLTEILLFQQNELSPVDQMIHGGGYDLLINTMFVHKI